jgi:hypothetical protein
MVGLGVILLRLTMVAHKYQSIERRRELKETIGYDVRADALAFFLLCDVAISSAVIIIVVSLWIFSSDANTDRGLTRRRLTDYSRLTHK